MTTLTSLLSGALISKQNNMFRLKKEVPIKQAKSLQQRIPEAIVSKSSPRKRIVTVYTKSMPWTVLL